MCIYLQLHLFSIEPIINSKFTLMFKHLLQVNNTVILNTKKYHIKQKQKLAKFIKGYHYAVLNVEEKWKFSYLLE